MEDTRLQDFVRIIWIILVFLIVFSYEIISFVRETCKKHIETYLGAKCLERNTQQVTQRKVLNWVVNLGWCL